MNPHFIEIVESQEYLNKKYEMIELIINQEDDKEVEYSDQLDVCKLQNHFII